MKDLVQPGFKEKATICLLIRSVKFLHNSNMYHMF